MTLHWFPVIDYKKCKGCLECVKFCHKKVYTVKEGLPKVTNKRGCVDNCRGCEPICPRKAITHVRTK